MDEAVEPLRAQDEGADDLARVKGLPGAGDEALEEGSRTPSEIISVWTPRSLRPERLAKTASGMAPMPICRVAPSSMRPATCSPILRSTSPKPSRLSSGRGQSSSTMAVKRET